MSPVMLVILICVVDSLIVWVFERLERVLVWLAVTGRCPRAVAGCLLNVVAMAGTLFMVIAVNAWLLAKFGGKS